MYIILLPKLDDVAKWIYSELDLVLKMICTEMDLDMYPIGPCTKMDLLYQKCHVPKKSYTETGLYRKR